MEFILKRIVVKSFDDDFGIYITRYDDMIITEQGNDKTYIGSNKIFSHYEEYLEDYKNKKVKYPTFNFEPPLIEIENITSVDNLDDVEHLKRLMYINGESEYVKSIYYRCQNYGGSEEGGWYYHTLHLSELSEGDELGTDRYGEGYVEYSEFYLGQNEKTGTQHYH